MHALAAKVEQSCHPVVVNSWQGLVTLRQESSGQAGFPVRLGTSVD